MPSEGSRWDGVWSTLSSTQFKNRFEPIKRRFPSTEGSTRTQSSAIGTFHRTVVQRHLNAPPKRAQARHHSSTLAMRHLWFSLPVRKHPGCAPLVIQLAATTTPRVCATRSSIPERLGARRFDEAQSKATHALISQMISQYCKSKS